MTPQIERAVAEDPREEKLPRWVRAKLSDMRIAVRSSRYMAEAAVVATDPDGSLIAVNHHEYRVGVKAPRLTLRTDTSVDWREGFEVRVEDDHLRISAESGRLAVYPHCSNVIHLKAPGRW